MNTKSLAPLVIWGMGNPLHGDDGAGVRAAEELLERMSSSRSSLGPCKVYVCETQPENFLGLLRREPPKTLLICDASQMGLPPGSLRRFTLQEMMAEGWSTHGYPLDRLLEPYLEAFPIHCLGIQPGNTDLGTDLSQEVRQGVETLVQLILEGKWAEIKRLGKGS